MKNIIFFIGESGCGKSTLQNKLIKNYPDQYTRIISTTTRSPRDKEVNGLDYHFKSKDEFENDIKSGLFFQYIKAGENYYGTKLEEYYKSQDNAIFVCTPEGVLDTIIAAKLHRIRFKPVIVFFDVSHDLLLSHGVSKERIERFNISKDMKESIQNGDFNGISIIRLSDSDINHDLFKKVHCVLNQGSGHE